MDKKLYMWVLDYTEGTVTRYDVSEIEWDTHDYTHEDFIYDNGHSPVNCEWMITFASFAQEREGEVGEGYTSIY